MNNFFMDQETGYLCYRTTQEDLEKAKALFDLDYSKTNNLNHKTVYNRTESRMAGLVGEVVFGQYYKGSCEYVARGGNPYDYIVHTPQGVSAAFDVKCKYRKVKPKPNFEASVYNYQAKSDFFKEVDYYAFLSTSGNFEKVWFCGFISKTELVCSEKSVFWAKGSVDPTNKKVFHEDTLSTFYKNLQPFRLN